MNTLPPSIPSPTTTTTPAALAPRPGSGTRLTVNPLGFSYSAAAGGRGFPHPFKPAANALGVSFSRGLVDVYEPTIKGAKISTGALLPLNADVANAAGESWACLEVTPNEFGQLDEKSRVEMVHTAMPLSNDPEIGRTPVALILWQNGRVASVRAVLMFNVRYLRAGKATEKPARHIFW